MKTLIRLLDEAGVKPQGLTGDGAISDIHYDSRLVGKGSLFVCMPGDNLDSHSFIEDAVHRGATAVMAYSRAGFERARAAEVACFYFEKEDFEFSNALWKICKAFFDNPSHSMKMVGVTGTNGKTTTAWMIRDMLAVLNVKSGYLGTLGFQIPGEARELANTTPFSVEVNRILAEARDKGVEAMAMEVSSHSLEQRRVDGVEFDVGAFTNLTQDHLDFHGSMEAYGAAKFRLFSELPEQSDKAFVAALNVDDPVGRQWAGQINRSALTFGEHDADLVGKTDVVNIDHIRLQLKYQDEEQWADVPIGGIFNVQNCLSASASLLALGYSLEAVAEALQQVTPVPGRFEAVKNDQGIGVIVDYAHTPDALIKLLESTRALNPGKLITVFGCGGDRDRTKRPIMASVVSERSDISVITSDNPRTEEPETILKDVEKGIVAGKESVSIIDRGEAVAHAMKAAKPGDIVVIAGKGHENYQVIGRTKYPMDDRELARKALEGLA